MSASQRSPSKEIVSKDVYGSGVSQLPVGGPISGTAKPNTEPEAPRGSPKDSASRSNRRYWLIVAGGPGVAQALAVSGKLAVFSFKEEAETFLAARDPGRSSRDSSGDGSEYGWRVREFLAGELVSTLYGPLCGFSSVALDPVTEDGERAVDGLLSVSRREFVNSLVRRASFPCQAPPEADWFRTIPGVER